MRDGVITKTERGKYAVNFDVALMYANAIPKAIGKRDYVALRGHNSVFGLPWHWAETVLQRQLFEETLSSATQGTTQTCPAQLAFPVTVLVTPSGRKAKAIELPDRYVIPTESLVHRSKVYCAYLGRKPICSPTLPQLYRYLTPPCPICPPEVPYPVPAGPSRVVGPLADYERRLIPLSALPHNARKYELGYQLFDPVLYAFHRFFNVRVRARKGMIYVTLKPRRGVVKRCLSRVLTVLPLIVYRYLPLLISALDAIAEYGRSYTGLSTPGLMARSKAILSEALYRRPKPKPAHEPVQLEFTEIRYRVKRYDPEANDFRWRSIRVPGGLSLSQLMALLGELEDFSAERPYRLTYMELTLAIPDPAGLALKFLGAGYLFIYNNPNKDPEGAIRIEFRPYRHVTSYVTPQDLNVMFYGLAMTLTVPLDLAMRAGLEALTARHGLTLTTASAKVWMS